ncbi:MAG: hypothetical protein ACI9QQ_000372 [Myxococcota bacterium]|jgi:hypothetical protein
MMTNPAAARSFFLSEVEGLEPFDFVLAVPSCQPLHAVEMTRLEAGEIEVRIPGRPPTIPGLDEAVRESLVKLGFASEDPKISTLPWTCSLANAENAVDLLSAVLTDVFGEKPDVTLDVRHGSHEVEHEARKKLAIARQRVEQIVTDVLGRPPEQDGDKDYVLPIGEVHVTVAPRATPDGQIVVRVFAISNVGFEVTPELGLFLARLNFGLMFGRFTLDVPNRSIWFDETLLGEQFREEELRFAIRVVASTADEWDDRLKKMFGGETYQSVLAGRSAEAPPVTKPGEGGGQYI